MNTTQVRSGGCLCGQVRYTISAAPDAVVVCHCRDCQKQAGSALSVLAVFPTDAVRIEGVLSRYETTGDNGNKVGRYFCGHCGSPIHSETPATLASGRFALKAGTLDDVSGLQPAAHLWVQSKQPWLQLPTDAHCVLQQ